MGLAAYENIGNDAEWRARHGGKAENVYETKEAAFEAAVAAAYEHVIFVAIAGRRSGVVRGGLLRVQQRDARERRLVAKVALVRVVPRVEALDDGEPAAVVQQLIGARPRLQGKWRGCLG